MADIKKEFNQREGLVSSGQPAGSINFEKQTGRIIVGQDDGSNLEYGIGRVVITSDELTNKKLSKKNINLLFNNHLAQWSAGVVKGYSSLMVFLNLPGVDFIRSLVPVSVTAYSQTQLLLSGTYMNMISSDLVYQHILVSVQSDGTMQIPNPLTFNDNGDGTKVLADNGQYVNMPQAVNPRPYIIYNSSAFSTTGTVNLLDSHRITGSSDFVTTAYVIKKMAALVNNSISNDAYIPDIYVWANPSVAQQIFDTSFTNFCLFKVEFNLAGCPSSLGSNTIVSNNSTVNFRYTMTPMFTWQKVNGLSSMVFTGVTGTIGSNYITLFISGSNAMDVQMLRNDLSTSFYLSGNGNYMPLPATPECSKIWMYNGSQESLAVGASSQMVKNLLMDWDGSNASSKVKGGDMYITTNHHLFLVTDTNVSSTNMAVICIGNMAHFEEGDELAQSSSSVPANGSVPLAAQYADYAVFSYEYNGSQAKTIANFVSYGFFKHRTSKIQYLLVKNLSSSGTLNISPGTGYFCNFETVTLKAKEGVELSIFKDVVLASSVINF